ncbi:MAG: DNA integrity scanning protein DisA nucleotide-binding domain protein [Desulfobacterales bacterium]|nr:DNA integrity scanning protein DisA nucleotide-binding domain protein [Desulfobacterales bacterium]
MDTPFAWMMGFRWQDLVDIGLVSFILFRLYVLFRGTQAIRVIVAIGLLWVFQRFSIAAGLIVTSWAFQGIIAAAALVIIVVFRSEIRIVLQTKSLRTLLWGGGYKRLSTPVEIIADAVFEMARKKTGALLVFPSRDDLDELTQGGIPLDGRLSREMLLSIFWAGNPVHDGAAVIIGDRIANVGVILPLTRREDLPSHYGTRHRAAAGLAESSDAVVVVVSEERGEVLTARGDRLAPVGTPEALADRLRRRVSPMGGVSDSRMRGRIEMISAALVSILFVTGVWFSFSRGLEALATLEVPVEYMNRDPAMELVETSTNTVSLDLSGSGPLIKALQPDQVKVRLDLADAVAGRNAFSVTADNILLPPGVRLKKVTPAEVDVTMDLPIEKTLPVQVDWVGKLDEKLRLTEIRVTPEKIQVVGRYGILNDKATVYTRKVSLDKIRQSSVMAVSLALEPAALRLAKGVSDRVSVAFTIEARSAASDGETVLNGTD